MGSIIVAEVDNHFFLLPNYRSLMSTDTTNRVYHQYYTVHIQIIPFHLKVTTIMLLVPCWMTIGQTVEVDQRATEEGKDLIRARD